MNSMEQKDSSLLSRIPSQESFKERARPMAIWLRATVWNGDPGTPFASAGPEGLVCASRIGRVGDGCCQLAENSAT